MGRLKAKGLSYGSIGILFGISRQRIHQLISGYITTGKRKRSWKKNRLLNNVFDMVFKRDNQTCQICGKRGTLIHHIDGDWKHNNFSNLICLCNNCHLDTHRPKHKCHNAKG